MLVLLCAPQAQFLLSLVMGNSTSRSLERTNEPLAPTIMRDHIVREAAAGMLALALVNVFAIVVAPGDESKRAASLPASARHAHSLSADRADGGVACRGTADIEMLAYLVNGIHGAFMVYESLVKHAYKDATMPMVMAAIYAAAAVFELVT